MQGHRSLTRLLGETLIRDGYRSADYLRREPLLAGRPEHPRLPQATARADDLWVRCPRVPTWPTACACSRPAASWADLIWFELERA